MEEAEGSIEVKDSGFLNESSISDMVGGKGSIKDMSRELSEILGGKGDESGENRLDQGVVEETGEDRDDQVDNLENMLKDVLDEARLDDEMDKVHRLSKPILSSSSDFEEQKDVAMNQPHEKAASSSLAEDTRGKSSTSATSFGLKARPESTGELLIEGDEQRSNTGLCGSCANTEVKGLLQSFCALF